MVEAPDRLGHPLKKTDEVHWKEISWDEALDFVAKKLRFHCKNPSKAAKITFCPIILQRQRKTQLSGQHITITGNHQTSF